MNKQFKEFADIVKTYAQPTKEKPMNTQSSDKPFVGAFFVTSCIDDNEERISVFFSHKEMARAFILACDVVGDEMLYLDVVRDEEHKQFLLDNIENMK
jgi:hypothetical protein